MNPQLLSQWVSRRTRRKAVLFGDRLQVRVNVWVCVHVRHFLCATHGSLYIAHNVIIVTAKTGPTLAAAVVAMQPIICALACSCLVVDLNVMNEL